MAKAILTLLGLHLYHITFAGRPPLAPRSPARLLNPVPKPAPYATPNTPPRQTECFRIIIRVISVRLYLIVVTDRLYRNGLCLTGFYLIFHTITRPSSRNANVRKKGFWKAARDDPIGTTSMGGAYMCCTDDKENCQMVKVQYKNAEIPGMYEAINNA